MTSPAFSDLRVSLDAAVQRVCRGTSEKFVPNPNKSQITEDLLIGLKRFNEAVRWKWYWIEVKASKLKRGDRSPSPTSVTDDGIFNFEDDESTSTSVDDVGLDTGIKPKEKKSCAPLASKEVEVFLKDVAHTLLSTVKNMKAKKVPDVVKEIRELQKVLDQLEVVIVPTDKTNSFVTMDTNEYVKAVEKELAKDAVEVKRERLVAVEKRAHTLLKSLEPVLSKDEFSAIRESILSKAIPIPLLLIKDHKDKVDGVYPTRLICPATNFVALFDKVGAMGIKAALDRNNIVYDTDTIIQASDLKESIEAMNVKKDDVTVVSFDCVKMYPSIKLGMVRRAVSHFSKGFSRDDRAKIRDCMRMVEFSMGNTLLTFQGKYYEYAGDLPVEERGLTIGGYGSAWLADLVAAFVLEKTKECFEKAKYKGVHRDDGLCILMGKWSEKQISEWLVDFQRKVDRALGMSHLQFTVEIWDADKESDAKLGKVKVVSKESFPFLDMEMYWEDQDLRFRVHLKDGQQLKYLNDESNHTGSCRKAIPSGVLHRLAKLTSVMINNANVPLDKLYPSHASALEIANLAPDKFPTLSEADASRKEKMAEKEAMSDRERKQKEKDRKRRTYFCIGYSKDWEVPVHAVLNKLKKKHCIKWLRIGMSYHKFSNLREQFQGDLNAKVMKEIASKDFIDRDCNFNCNNSTKINGKCACYGKCRRACVIYSATCKICDKVYIGATQGYLKNRMGPHYGDVRRLVNSGKKSDSFADHMAHHFFERGLDRATVSQARQMVDMDIVWQGDAISCMKSFGKKSCKLCMKERTTLLKLMEEKPDKMINAKSEIFGGCRHKTRFHRHTKKKQLSTDDGDHPERVNDSQHHSYWWMNIVPVINGVIVCPTANV